MNLIVTTVRRAVIVVLLAAALGAASAWWRDRQQDSVAPAEWPPIPPVPPVDATTGWVAPDVDGACPIGQPIKANSKSGIFHVPGGRFYARTRPERCYSDSDAALADGYRRAKN